MRDDDPLAESNRRLKLLEEELAAAPVVTVSGVVEASGVGGVQSYGQPLWTAVFSLDGWKLNDGPIEAKPLTVRKEMTESELDALRDDVTPYAVVKLEVRFVRVSIFGDSQSRLERVVGASSDAELVHHAADLQRPVHRNDSLLGEFTLDRAHDQFDANLKWEKRDVRLSVPKDHFDGAVKTARALWASSAQWDEKIRTFAAKQLLELKNETWLDDDEAKVTPAEFKRRLVLTAIVIEDDGSFSFWFDDGDLFFGHEIHVTGTLKGGLKTATIEG
jgi:hypothetical protein